MLRWTLSLVGLFAALMVLPMVAGMFVARGHTASSAILLEQPIDSVWQVVSDLGGYPRWWHDVRAMERTEQPDRGPIWIQRDTRGQELPIAVDSAVPPTLFATRIAGPKLPFEGTWTYEMATAAGGTRVVVTERGEIFNPVYRVMARYFLGYHGTIDRYLEALGSHFGERVAPVHMK